MSTSGSDFLVRAMYLLAAEGFHVQIGMGPRAFTAKRVPDRVPYVWLRSKYIKDMNEDGIVVYKADRSLEYLMAMAIEIALAELGDRIHQTAATIDDLEAKLKIQRQKRSNLESLRTSFAPIEDEDEDDIRGESQ